MRNVNEEWRQKSSESEDKAPDFLQVLTWSRSWQKVEAEPGRGRWRMVERRKEGRGKSGDKARRAFCYDQNISNWYELRFRCSFFFFFFLNESNISQFFAKYNYNLQVFWVNSVKCVCCQELVVILFSWLLVMLNITCHFYFNLNLFRIKDVPIRIQYQYQ